MTKHEHIKQFEVAQNETASTLQYAKELIKIGWCQYNEFILTDEATQYCAGGAIRKAAATSGVSSLIHLAAVNCLVKVTNSSIAIWNDQPHRTQSEVLAAFDVAIDIALAKKCGNANVEKAQAK